MTDFSDKATEREELDRDLAVAAARSRAGGPPDIGQCHNCGEPLQPGMRFCDLDCRDDWQKRQGRG